MRIWHEKLIPCLCRNHILGVWREALGAYKIITEGKLGYRFHPATKEFLECPEALHYRLRVIREEMLRRGYNPKELPELVEFGGVVREWQTLEEQVEVLRGKGCECNLSSFNF